MESNGLKDFDQLAIIIAFIYSEVDSNSLYLSSLIFF